MSDPHDYVPDEDLPEDDVWDGMDDNLQATWIEQETM